MSEAPKYQKNICNITMILRCASFYFFSEFTFFFFSLQYKLEFLHDLVVSCDFDLRP